MKPNEDDLILDLGDLHSYGVSASSREIFLHSISGYQEEDPGIDFRMATQFVKNLAFLNSSSFDPILIHLHSFGGSWPDGMAIYDAIRLSPSPITIIGYAQVASMASVILQAADLRLIMPNCPIMIHEGSIGIESTSRVVFSNVEEDRKNYKLMLDLFVERVKHSAFFKKKRWNSSKITKFLDNKLQKRGDWFLDANEALELGFIDGVIGQGKYKYINSYRAQVKWQP